MRRVLIAVCFANVVLSCRERVTVATENTPAATETTANPEACLPIVESATHREVKSAVFVKPSITSDGAKTTITCSPPAGYDSVELIDDLVRFVHGKEDISFSYIHPEPRHDNSKISVELTCNKSVNYFGINFNPFNGPQIGMRGLARKVQKAASNIRVQVVEHETRKPVAPGNEKKPAAPIYYEKVPGYPDYPEFPEFPDFGIFIAVKAVSCYAYKGSDRVKFKEELALDDQFKGTCQELPHFQEETIKNEDGASLITEPKKVHYDNSKLMSVECDIRSGRIGEPNPYVTEVEYVNGHVESKRSYLLPPFLVKEKFPMQCWRVYNQTGYGTYDPIMGIAALNTKIGCYYDMW